MIYILKLLYFIAKLIFCILMHIVYLLALLFWLDRDKADEWMGMDEIYLVNKQEPNIVRVEAKGKNMWDWVLDMTGKYHLYDNSYDYEGY